MAALLGFLAVAAAQSSSVLYSVQNVLDGERLHLKSAPHARLENVFKTVAANDVARRRRGPGPEPTPSAYYFFRRGGAAAWRRLRGTESLAAAGVANATEILACASSDMR